VSKSWVRIGAYPDSDTIFICSTQVGSGLNCQNGWSTIDLTKLFTKNHEIIISGNLQVYVVDSPKISIIPSLSLLRLTQPTMGFSIKILLFGQMELDVPIPVPVPYPPSQGMRTHSLKAYLPLKVHL
jgi:hypothetical protein